VTVPRLFEVERYDTLFQMTSTVTARTEAPVEEILAAIFPCASITGAPKIRTMEIIDRLEEGPRGIYSGAIGYFGLNGDADLNIVIRTIVAADDLLSIGIGGAIVALSDPEAELEETFVKGAALLRALELTLPEPAVVAGRAGGQRELPAGRAGGQSELPLELK
ncbi:MAG: chorismate-binding protein, partial [Thermoguttaceae bacterium]